MRRVAFPVILLSLFISANRAACARADEPGASAAVAAPAEKKAGPGQPASTDSINPAPSAAPANSQPASAVSAKKQEAKKLKPVVVTATKIEQPLADIGTTVTVDDGVEVNAGAPAVSISRI